MSMMIDLTNEEVAQVKAITCLQDDGTAVTKAVREYLRLTRLRELKAVSGKVDYEGASVRVELLDLLSRSRLRPPGIGSRDR